MVAFLRAKLVWLVVTTAVLVSVTPCIRAFAQDLPASAASVVELELPADARVSIQNHDYGTQRRFSYGKLKPGGSYEIAVEVTFADGQKVTHPVGFIGGQNTRKKIEPPTANTRSTVPVEQSAPAARSVETGSQRWAVLVGVNDYAQAQDLEYCVADQQALHKQLVASGVPKDHIFLLHDGAQQSKYFPFKSNIEKQLQLALALAEQNDFLIVAFSGHGVQLDGAAYLCPTDAKLSDPETLVSLDWVYEQMKRSPAALKLLLVDACRNDPRVGGQRSFQATEGARQFAQTLDKAPPEGIVLLTSCSPGEISMEEKAFGHGVFMHYLLEGLQGKADGDRNGRISLNELSRYAGQETKVYVARKFNESQRPKLKGDLTIEALDFEVATSLERSQLPEEKFQGDIKPGETITNSIGMKLTLIPPGEFMMGSEEDAISLLQRFSYVRPEDVAGQWPQHKVKITKPFYLGTYEVTLSQFLKFYHDAHYKTDAERDGKGGWGWNGTSAEQRRSYVPWSWGFKAYGGDHPVVNVSWNDATAFCHWLSKKEDATYRLPTESEWEYACRAGSMTRYWFGNDPEDLVRNANAADQAQRQTWPLPDNLVIARLEGEKMTSTTTPFPFLVGHDGYGFTAPIGRFRPNPFGLYDIHGNAWEWCADWYSIDYYARSPEADPTGPTSGSERVLRGGGWNDTPQDQRTAFREKRTPNFRMYDLGFRVVRSFESQ